MIKSEDDFVRFKVDENDKNLARQIRKKRDSVYGNIYEEKESDTRWSGDLGEIKVNQALMMCNVDKTDWIFDIEAAGKCDIIFFGRTIDVKTVKRKVPMRLEYTAQITAKHARSNVDYLIFACYEVKKDEIVIIGAINKSEFLKDAKYYPAGSKVHNNYTIREGHEIYNIEVSKLTPFRDFIKESRKNTKESP